MDTVTEDLKAFGVGFEPPAWMRERESEQEQSFDVMPENWEAVQLFCACATQWRTNPDGPLRYLPYEAVDVLLRRMKLEDPDTAFEKLRIMEAAVRENFSHRQAS